MRLLFLKLLFIAIEKENYDLFVIKVAVVFWHDNNRRQGHRKIKYLKKGNESKQTTNISTQQCA